MYIVLELFSPGYWQCGGWWSLHGMVC